MDSAPAAPKPQPARAPMGPDSTGMGTRQAFTLWALVAVLGLGIGFGLGKLANTSGASGSNPDAAPQATTTANSSGIKDTKRFPDTAEGKLVEGGIEGEGSFHLERPGGESQNVYLTSSIVDLSEFVGKKVRVMGQTFAGQKAGWLMDVGYVEKL